MRTLVFVAVFAFVVPVLAPQSVLAAGWGGGVSVPGWDPWAGQRSTHWDRGGTGQYSGHVVRHYWASPSPASSQVACVINPSSNRASLAFWVDNRQYVLAPGTQQAVSFLPGQTILFDRGAGRGFVRYSLEGTSYTFSPTSIGWELYRTVPGAASSIAAGQPPAPNSTPDNARSTLPSAGTPRPVQR